MKDYEKQEKVRQSIRDGVCPECGGKLDQMRRRSANVFGRCVSERRCYECHSVFYMPDKED